MSGPCGTHRFVASVKSNSTQIVESEIVPDFPGFNEILEELQLEYIPSLEND
ncbi:MAG TPA: hypothetical protein VLZ83_08010 [Edaphocola sp.]|nr:hypothetical protein [Edaphocola sp.]